MLTTKIRHGLASIAFAALALTATPSFAQEAKVPDTVAEHEAMAKKYQDEAAQYLKVAEGHKQMAAAYAKAHPENPKQKNPWNAKMAKHCQMLAKDAEKLATDAQKAADFHTLRAKELQGK